MEPLTDQQSQVLHEAIGVGVAETMGQPQPVRHARLMQRLEPVVAQMVAEARAVAQAEVQAEGLSDISALLGGLAALGGAPGAGPSAGGPFERFGPMFGSMFGGPDQQDVDGAVLAGTYERPADLVGGADTTAPFAVIQIDQVDWPYNEAFVSTDAALLHRIENDKSQPFDEVLMEAMAGTGQPGDGPYTFRSVGSGETLSTWGASVEAALAKAGIGPERRFEGRLY